MILVNSIKKYCSNLLIITVENAHTLCYNIKDTAMGIDPGADRILRKEKKSGLY